MSGHLASGACDRVFLEWFPPGQKPAQQCSTHLRVAVDRRTGRPAGLEIPSEQIELKTQVRLPTRYASWMSEVGLAPEAPAATAPKSWPRISVERTAEFRITSPTPDLRLVYDPETPAELSTLALQAVVDPPVQQLVWYVDDLPFQTVDYPSAVRWPLKPGEHVFEVRLPHRSQTSRKVRVWVE